MLLEEDFIVVLQTFTEKENVKTIFQNNKFNLDYFLRIQYILPLR